MKTMNLILTTILFLQLGISCKKEKIMESCSNPSKPSIEKINDNFTKIWDVKNKKGFICLGTIVTTNEVIYFVKTVAEWREDIISFNKETGDTLWFKQGINGITDKYKLIGNYIYISLSDRLVCIDPSNGNEVWRFSPGYLTDYLYANNNIYAFFETRDSLMLYKLNPINGVGTKIHTIYTADRGGYIQSANGITHWKHPNGNDIIFVQSSALKISMGRGEYYAIDVTADSMYWDLGEYFYDGTLNSGGIGSPPIVNGNNVILNQGWIYNASLDLLNKTVNWKTKVPEVSRTRGGTMVVINNKIFQSVGNPNDYSGSSSVFNTFDLNTGLLLKSLKNVGYDWKSSPLKVYNNQIYFTATEYIEIVDATTGELTQKILYNEQIGDNLGGYPANGLDVDQTNGYIYTTRGFSFVCIKEK